MAEPSLVVQFFSSMAEYMRRRMTVSVSRERARMAGRVCFAMGMLRRAARRTSLLALIRGVASARVIRTRRDHN